MWRHIERGEVICVFSWEADVPMKGADCWLLHFLCNGTGSPRWGHVLISRKQMAVTISKWLDLVALDCNILNFKKIK